MDRLWLKLRVWFSQGSTDLFNREYINAALVCGCGGAPWVFLNWGVGRDLGPGRRGGQNRRSPPGQKVRKEAPPLWFLRIRFSALPPPAQGGSWDSVALKRSKLPGRSFGRFYALFFRLNLSSILRRRLSPLFFDLKPCMLYI